MTYEDLLARISDSDATNNGTGWKLLPIPAALRAVVELHKRVVPDLGFENKHITYCEGCSIYEIVDWASCPTIQAIEKELS